MLVSIIIPVYNAAPYIVRCLNSVINQNYTGNMECIIVDDCGSDGSIQMVEQFIFDHQGTIHINITAHEYNRGLSAARNTGIEASQGEYLYFLDADDWLEPDCISSMLALANRHPEAEMIQAGAISHGGEAKPWLNMCESSLPESLQGKDVVKPIMLDRTRIPVTAWNRLVKKDFILHQHLFFQEGLIHEDELWTFQLAKSLNYLAVLKRNTYHYEHHDTGLMATDSIQKDASYATIVRQMISDIDDCCTVQTVSYIANFIHTRSFDVRAEAQRIALLDCLSQLYPYYSFCKKLNARLWLSLAKFPIRDHYWLYSLLYHWKI